MLLSLDRRQILLSKQKTAEQEECAVTQAANKLLAAWWADTKMLEEECQKPLENSVWGRLIKVRVLGQGSVKLRSLKGRGGTAELGTGCTCGIWRLCCSCAVFGDCLKSCSIRRRHLTQQWLSEVTAGWNWGCLTSAQSSCHTSDAARAVLPMEGLQRDTRAGAGCWSCSGLWPDRWRRAQRHCPGGTEQFQAVQKFAADTEMEFKAEKVQIFRLCVLRLWAELSCAAQSWRGEKGAAGTWLCLGKGVALSTAGLCPLLCY